MRYDPDAEKDEPDFLWLWIMLGIIGAVIIGCIIAVTVAALKKRKIDMLLGLNEDDVSLFDKEFSE